MSNNQNEFFALLDQEERAFFKWFKQAEEFSSRVPSPVRNWEDLPQFPASKAEGIQLLKTDVRIPLHFKQDKAAFLKELCTFIIGRAHDLYEDRMRIGLVYNQGDDVIRLGVFREIGGRIASFWYLLHNDGGVVAISCITNFYKQSVSLYSRSTELAEVYRRDGINYQAMLAALTKDSSQNWLLDTVHESEEKAHIGLFDVLRDLANGNQSPSKSPGCGCLASLVAIVVYTGSTLFLMSRVMEDDSFSNPASFFLVLLLIWALPFIGFLLRQNSIRSKFSESWHAQANFVQQKLLCSTLSVTFFPFSWISESQHRAMLESADGQAFIMRMSEILQEIQGLAESN